MPVPMPIPETPPDALRRLAQAVRGLMPSWQDPEPFHLAKSEIASALAQLARRLHEYRLSVPAPRVAPAVTPAPRPKIVLVRGFPGTCARCGKTFQASQPTKRFCSHACRQATYRERRDGKAGRGAPGAPAARPVVGHAGTP